MGIDVLPGKSVVFNGSHENLVVTSSSMNPHDDMFGSMRVQSIFQRVMSKDRMDGNPLIYALKRKRSFNISAGEVRRFLPDFQAILKKSVQGAQFEMVIPMPSAHGISTIIAQRVVRATGYGKVEKNLLRKKTNAEVLAELRILELPAEDPDSAKTRRALISHRKLLETVDGAASFSMKEVDSVLRPYIQPMTLLSNPVKASPRILLVDDLISSGATLVSARDALLAIFPEAQVEGLCLLSKLQDTFGQA